MANIVLFGFVGIAVLMTFFILLQKGNGATGLDGTKARNVDGSANPIRRATWWMARMFFVLAVVLAMIR